MKAHLLSMLQCPECASPLRLSTVSEEAGEVREGSLDCMACSFTAPIVDYIPRFVDRSNYSHSWGELWQATGEILRDSYTGIPFHTNVIHGHYDESGEAREGASPFGFEWPRDLAGQTVLEIGPGTGNCTEVLAATGATLVSVDMSHAVDTLPAALITRPNVNVIQGDITSGFLRQGAFDRIWFFQVLQHTPEPRSTLKAVRPFLRDGGELAVTSYGGHFDPWYYKHTRKIDDARAWRLIATLTPSLVRIKYALMRFGDALGSRTVRDKLAAILGFVDPRNIYYRTLQGQMNDYIMGRIWTERRDRKLLMMYVIINTFDAITPEYTNNCPDLATMESWLAEAGFRRCETWGKGGVRAKAWT